MIIIKIRKGYEKKKQLKNDTNFKELFLTLMPCFLLTGCELTYFSKNDLSERVFTGNPVYFLNSLFPTLFVLMLIRRSFITFIFQVSLYENHTR